MHIITGRAKGVKLQVAKTATRPTTQRVKEALFTVLSNYLDFEQCSVLDLYAGSGALGLEAWSRGAKDITFVEANSKAGSVIKANIAKLEVKQVVVANCSVSSFLKRATIKQYNIIFSDPPYDLPFSFVLKDLHMLTTKELLSIPGCLVLELAKFESKNKIEQIDNLGWEILFNRDFGDTNLCILTRQKIS